MNSTKLKYVHKISLLFFRKNMVQSMNKMMILYSRFVKTKQKKNNKIKRMIVNDDYTRYRTEEKKDKDTERIQKE